jgi:hypothetical protein
MKIIKFNVFNKILLDSRELTAEKITTVLSIHKLWRLINGHDEKYEDEFNVITLIRKDDKNNDSKELCKT